MIRRGLFHALFKMRPATDKPRAGQVVRDDRQIMYASVFRDVVAEVGEDVTEGASSNWVNA